MSGINLQPTVRSASLTAPSLQEDLVSIAKLSINEYLERTQLAARPSLDGQAYDQSDVAGRVVRDDDDDDAELDLPDTSTEHLCALLPCRDLPKPIRHMNPAGKGV